MARCLTKLNNRSYQAELDMALFMSDFSDELESYYRGSADAPSIDLLVSEINTQILPQFLSSSKYNLDDLRETIEDPDNAAAIKSAFLSLLQKRRQLNLNAELPSYHKDRKFDLVDNLVSDLNSKIQTDLASKKENQDIAAQVDEAMPLSKIDNEHPYDNYVHDRAYQNLRAYRIDRFKTSSSIENLTVSKFLTDVFLKNVFIDVDNGRLIDQTQRPGQPSEIDTNLKNYRKNLLKDLIERLNIQDTSNSEVKPLEFNNNLLTYKGFNKALRSIADSVMQVRYKNELVSLDAPGKLFEITEDYKNSQKPELKNIVDNFTDYVILSDFNKLFEYYGGGAIDVSKYNDDFDPSLRKYSTKNALSLDAINASWNEQMQNGVELTSPLYQSIIKNTEIINYSTGKPTGKFIYPTLISSAFAPHFNSIDRNNPTESIRTIIKDNLKDPKIARTDKNVFYTLYKKFFELDGDAPVVELKRDGVPKKNFNTKVASFYNTVRDNKDQSLMLLITKPLMETAKVNYLEAIEGFDGTVSLSNSNAKNKTGVGFTSTRFIEDNINKSKEDLFGSDDIEDKGFIKKWDIQFYNTPSGSVTRFTSPLNHQDYELRESNNIEYDVATIKALSKDLLGLDFTHDKRHIEFWEEIQSLAEGDEEIAPVYMAYLKDAMNIIQARVILNDENIQKTLREKSNDKYSDNITNYNIINNAIRTDRSFNMINPTTYKFKLNTQNAKVINDLIYTAENNYTGNRLKSVVSTVQGTTVAGYSTYNYALGLKQNLESHRRALNSANKSKVEKSPLYNNIFINDENALDDLFVRGAAKVGPTVKGNTSQTDYETMHFNINLAYFGKLAESLENGTPAKPVFDTIVYSDKGQNYLAAVNNNIIPRGASKTSLFLTDNKMPVDEKSVKQLLYETSAQYYRAYGQNIIDNWKGVFSAAGHGSVFEKEINSKKTISAKLTALNELNEGKSPFWKVNEFEHGLKGFDAARYYASKANVALNNWVDFDNSTKSLGPRTKLSVKADLINNISHFDNDQFKMSKSFSDKYEAQLVKFANELVDIHFKFDPTAASAITKLYPDTMSNFGGGDYGEIKITKGNVKATGVDAIHPALRKFFYDFNLIRENLSNVSIGSAYAHKGGDENKMLLTQNKRNVAMTASVRNYTLGLETGVEDFTRTAFVDDLVHQTKTILGDTHPVVVFDGASFETMSQRVKTWNSLNAKFNGDGGIVHKSFVSHFDPHTAQFGETKHAAFAMTNDMIRQSIGSNIDLSELHKELYNTDISSADITKSWKSGVNLSTFDDVFYHRRGLDFKTGLYGTTYKLDRIEYLGKDANGKSEYNVYTTNLSANGESTPVKQNIDTMHDLWQVLGGIDSVIHTDEKTGFFYFDSTGKNKIHLTDKMRTAETEVPVHTSAAKLVEFESYIGDAGDQIVPESYIDGSRNSVRAGYETYKSLFDTNGLVQSHVDLINAHLDGASNLTALALNLKGKNVKVSPEVFDKTIRQEKDNLKDLFDNVSRSITDGTAIVRPHQPFKGKNIDRISLAGAQKVGQYSLNSIETLHLGKRAEYLNNKGLQGDPGIPGITRLITHPISNFNAGIQLNAWHETENAVVTTPTQMLNALIFNAKKLGKVQQMYSAIGNIVDKELTYILGRTEENIPQLVRDLANNYRVNKDKLLHIFKDIMENKVAKDKDAEFTLENIIVDMFNHHDFPIDDPQIFHSAIAELTNYFTKTGIRTKFNGLFAVLAPATDILQVHDVQGGYIPVKNDRGGFDLKKLEPNETRILQKAEYNEYKRLNDHLGENDHSEDVRNHALTSKTLNDTPRSLKGQQVEIKYADGSHQDLSALNNNESHLIPEAKALDIAKTHINDFKDHLNSQAYKKLDEEGKIKSLDTKYKEFLSKFDELRTNHPEIEHVLSTFKLDLDAAAKTSKLKGNILKFAYENFSQSRESRDNKIQSLEKSGSKKDLRIAKEHEFFDKLNTTGQLFIGNLQRFLDHADRGYIDADGNVSHIPASLHNPALFENAHKVHDAKVNVTRAEAIAPIVAKKAFLLRDGDSITDITADLLKQRLYDTLDYFDVNADGVLISKQGKKIFLHKGLPAPGTKANIQHPNISEFKGKKWFTNDSRDRLFQVPDDMFVTNINGNLHVFLNKHDIANNPLIKSLDLGFGRQGDQFALTLLGSKEDRMLSKLQKESEFDVQSQEMHSSWQVYINKLIGTRVPGQHFQSFQGMKIVGFSEGNNIHVSDSVILLSGADFDIDKQNIIYHTVDADGRLAMWHPASNLSTPELLEESLKLPMPSNRTAEDFTSEQSPTGEPLDKVINMPDNLNLDDVHVLNGIYHMLDKGYKLDAIKHPNTIAKLVQHDSADVSINGVKNFAVSNTNQIIESPSNFLYLSNGVNTDNIKQFSSRTPKADKANEALKENPHSQSRQKEENMVGKMGIGIMASQMKVLSTVQFATNTAIERIGDLYSKLQNIHSINENYKYHLDAIHDPHTAYTGSHTKEQLEQSIQQLTARDTEVRDEIKYLVNAIGGSQLTLPNINLDLLHEAFQEEGPFDSLHRSSDNKYMKSDKRIDFAKIASMFDADEADVDSQFLSTSTDNAKELDLGKINGTPDLMTLFPSMGLKGVPLEQRIDLTTSKQTEMLLRNATKNVYDKTTADNSIADLLRNVDTIIGDKPSELKANAIERLLSNYHLQYIGEDKFTDTNTREVYDGTELVGFMNQYYKPAQMATLLAKYLGINQGIPSNNWDLYNFSTNMQDVINSIFSKAKSPYRFSFKTFLDSLATDGDYHKDAINRTSQFFQNMGLNYNPLFILSSNPHFAKQLTAFNASNTMLRESSYRVNSIYHIVEKLRDMGYLSENGNIKKNDFQEVEKFVESTIIDSFIKSESLNNATNPKEAPIFYNKHVRMDLSNSDDRRSFVEWMQKDFMRDIGENPALKGNAFTQDLRIDEKLDPLSFDKVPFIKLQMDTTNVKSNLEQGPFRDAYVAGLKDIYDNGYTDLNNNNIFNSLFWYNLIVNKNNITKNSYAKLIGDVMWQNDLNPNVYSRLFLLKGKIGKTTQAQLNLESTPGTDAYYRLNIGGINFDLRDLFLNHEIGHTNRLAASRDEQSYDIDFGDEGAEEINFEDSSTDTGSFDSEPEPEAGESFDVFTEDEAAAKQRNKLTIQRDKQTGVPGTAVTMNINGKSEMFRVLGPTTILPTSTDRNTIVSNDIGYNPFADLKSELRPDQNQAYNYYKMSIGNIHQLLSRLGDAITVEIKQGDKDFEVFDRNKDYDC
jgi:hypothetical protein